MINDIIARLITESYINQVDNFMFFILHNDKVIVIDTNF